MEKTLIDNTRKISFPTREDPVAKSLRLTFTVIEGVEPDFGRVFQFSEGPVLMGRHPDNHIRLSDPRVSQYHCRAEVTYGDDLVSVTLRDMGSTNGTFVNREPAQNRLLNSGDKVEIGGTILQYTCNDRVEEQYRSRLFAFATTDPLTGLFNRRHLMGELEAQFSLLRRYGRTFSVIMLDIDHFKAINDRYGHLGGDEYLCQLADLISHLLREQDIAARFGGEEFLLLLPETGHEGALILAERIRQRVGAMRVAHNQELMTTTVSVGVGTARRDEDMNDFLRRVDNALYQAKAAGRDRVVFAGGGG